MNFDFYSFRFRFAARQSIRFPEGRAGNVLRGALGLNLRRIHCGGDCPGHFAARVRECDRRGVCAYARIFEPQSADAQPSGLADWPRPFVLRASHLDGKTIEPGESFFFDLNLFDTRNPNLENFVQAFSQWNDLVAVDPLDRHGCIGAGPISISLAPASVMDARVRVQFRAPIDLKGSRPGKPEFAVLFARAQDRISTLRGLYGPGPLAVDFKGMRARAAEVRMTHCDVRHVFAKRRSSRTGTVHKIGGFIGAAEYEGALGEFLPYLEAARWTGVGRQCVWGKGEVHVELKTW